MLGLNVKSHNATNIIRNSRDLRQINSGKDNYALMSNHYEFKIRSSMSIYRKMKARNTWLECQNFLVINIIQNSTKGKSIQLW